MTPKQAAYTYRRARAAARRRGKQVLLPKGDYKTIAQRARPAKPCPIEDLPPYLQEARKEYDAATAQLHVPTVKVNRDNFFMMERG